MTILTRHPWLLVVLAFAILIAAWTGLVVVAVRNQPESVPLEHAAPASGPDRPDAAADPGH